MRPRPRPARHGGREEVQGSRLFGLEKSTELVREHIPVLVEPRLCTVADALRRRLVAVGAEALRVIDDADRGVAVRGDEDEAADGLRRLSRQQTALWMAQSKPDQDRSALGHHRAVVQYQRRDLREPIDLLQLLESWPGLPARRLH